MKRKFALWLQLMSFLYGPPVLADIYTWENDQGVVQFSQFKPMDNRVSLKYQPNAIQTVATVHTNSVSRPETSKKVEAKAAKLRPRKRRKQILAECSAMKKQVQQMQSRMRMGYKSNQEKKLRLKKRDLERSYYLSCIK